jgi:hypothetical protein
MERPQYSDSGDNIDASDGSDNYDDNELDSDAINDFTSQELDKRIKQMKAKIKDLQENEMKFGITE